MKKFIVSAILFVTGVTGYAQSVDNFVVGPYEVDYKGEGDFKFRLRKGVDLYEYFGLKRDTIIYNTTEDFHPVKNGIQVNAFMSLPRFALRGNSNIFGLCGSWKQQIGKILYLNGGLSFGFSYGEYNNDVNNKYSHREDEMLEIGMPLSLEFTQLEYKKASVYVGIGVVPTFYTTIKANEIANDGKKQNGKKDSGFLVSPRIDFGGYIPMKKQFLRIGVYGEYKLNCSGDINIYKDRIGRAFIGANVGLIF